VLDLGVLIGCDFAQSGQAVRVNEIQGWQPYSLRDGLHEEILLFDFTYDLFWSKRLSQSRPDRHLDPNRRLDE
jgi:hypothetical protein